MAGDPFRGDAARYEVPQGTAGLVHPSPPVARDVQDQVVADYGGCVEAAGGAEGGEWWVGHALAVDEVAVCEVVGVGVDEGEGGVWGGVLILEK